jgi:hypothetical protein
MQKKGKGMGVEGNSVKMTAQRNTHTCTSPTHR